MVLGNGIDVKPATMVLDNGKEVKPATVVLGYSRGKTSYSVTG